MIWSRCSLCPPNRAERVACNAFRNKNQCLRLKECIVFRREYITSSGYLSGHRSAPLRSGKNPGGADCKGHSFRTAKPLTVPKEDRSRPGHTRHPRPIALRLHQTTSTNRNLSFARKYRLAGKPCCISGPSAGAIRRKTDAPNFQAGQAHTFPPHERPNAPGLPSGSL